MDQYTTKEILQGIIDHDSNVLDFIYNEYFRYTSDFIRRNNGSEEEAWDIFQDAILVIYEKLKREELELSSTFKTYFYAVCKNLWLKAIRDEKSKKYNVSNENIDHLEDNDPSVLEIIEETQRERLFQKHFLKLSEECQRILTLSFEGMSGEKIAEKMIYSVRYAYNKKRSCRNRLIKNIQNDPEYKRFNI